MILAKNVKKNLLSTENFGKLKFYVIDFSFRKFSVESNL